MVANVILEAPTMFLIKSERPYCLNSETMLSYRNTQTIMIDTETISCAIIDALSIVCVFLFMCV